MYDMVTMAIAIVFTCIVLYLMFQVLLDRVDKLQELCRRKDKSLQVHVIIKRSLIIS